MGLSMAGPAASTQQRWLTVPVRPSGGDRWPPRPACRKGKCSEVSSRLIRSNCRGLASLDSHGTGIC
jgi:hypothetical protein